MDKVNIVPGFILKLWRMINDPQCDDLIAWSDNGESFIVLDPPRFSQQLSKYFKHNNLSSFIRQLNMYGFRKVATIENCGLQPANEDLHFHHPDFIRDHPEKLELIKRKLPQKITETIDIRNVVKDISDIEDKQKDVSRTLQDLKRENEMLWAELHDLRQKHQQQQIYISSLMKLVFEAMELKHGFKSNVLARKRNSPLMIANVDQEAAQSLATSTAQMLENNAPMIENTAVSAAIVGFTSDTASTSPAVGQMLDTTTAGSTHHQHHHQEMLEDAVSTAQMFENAAAVAAAESPDGQMASWQDGDLMQVVEPNQMQISENVSQEQIEMIAASINHQGDQIDQLIPFFEEFESETPVTVSVDEIFSSPGPELPSKNSLT